MNLGTAQTIFENIDSDKYTVEEKCLAIYMIMNQDTHNGVRKADVLKVLRWLWNQHFELQGMMSLPTLGIALAIFENIDNDKYTVEEKGMAIYMIMNQETHNGVRKADILKALRWLWHQQFRLQKEKEQA